MIHSFRFRNFCSFRDWATLSFEVGKQAPDTDGFFVSPAGQRLTKLLAIVGANASGKTNLLKALAFLRWFMLDSFSDIKAKDKIPFDPFRFTDTPDLKTEFELNFEVKETVYRYCLTIDANQVFREELYKKAGRNYRYLFKRWRDEAENQLQIVVKDGSEDVSALKKLLEGRDNAAMFSILKQLGSKQFEVIFDTFDAIHTNVVNIGRRMPSIPDHVGLIINAAEFCAENPELKNKIEHMLTSFDLGMTGLEIEKRNGQSSRFD